MWKSSLFAHGVGSCTLGPCPRTVGARPSGRFHARLLVRLLNALPG